jgi:hypothetical protein
MAEKEVIVREKLNFKGYADFKEFYKFAHDWLREEEFNLTEDTYEEKITGNKKDINIVWSISKVLTDYFKITGNIKITANDVEDVEVEIDGKKKEMNKLSLKLDIKGVLVKDHSSNWSGSGKFFKELYDKYIIPKRTEGMQGEVDSTMKEFKEEMKAFLELTGKR